MFEVPNSVDVEDVEIKDVVVFAGFEPRREIRKYRDVPLFITNTKPPFIKFIPISSDFDQTERRVEVRTSDLVKLEDDMLTEREMMLKGDIQSCIFESTDISNWKDAFSKGDLVTVANWYDQMDESYCGDGLEVLEVKDDSLKVRILKCNKLTILHKGECEVVKIHPRELTRKEIQNLNNRQR